MGVKMATASRFLLALTVLTGVIYPAAVTVVAQFVFPFQAHGSFVQLNGRTVGSALIAQRFEKPEYFHPRPSAAGPDGYDVASSGSNLGPTSARLVERVRASVDAYRRENGYAGLVPVDAVTTSASGLDPHISPANAAIQAERGARARGAERARVVGVVGRFTEAPWIGFVGEPRVNVLLLNIALDRELPLRAAIDAGRAR
jgi:potassium-transporting ATPase KdpC subunit